MASTGPRSGLIIEVPEAEPAVHRYRERLDANAPLGIPAHITVLAPFMPPETIDAGTLAGLGRLFAEVSRFRFLQPDPRIGSATKCCGSARSTPALSAT